MGFRVPERFALPAWLLLVEVGRVHIVAESAGANNPVPAEQAELRRGGRDGAGDEGV
jgi:hypothetical protein